MQERCARKRKRSKRRSIYCPTHNYYLNSVSQKYYIYCNHPSHLREQGIGKQASRRILENKSEVVLRNAWLEAFWCDKCQNSKWFYITKTETGYKVKVASAGLWQRVVGVVDPRGNPSVSEFTRKNSQMPKYKEKQFKYASY